MRSSQSLFLVEQWLICRSSLNSGYYTMVAIGPINNRNGLLFPETFQICLEGALLISILLPPPPCHVMLSKLMRTHHQAATRGWTTTRKEQAAGITVEVPPGLVPCGRFGLQSQCHSGVHLPANTHPGREQVVALVLRSLVPM